LMNIGASVLFSLLLPVHRTMCVLLQLLCNHVSLMFSDHVSVWGRGGCCE
jgi:hypothetical protein